MTREEIEAIIRRCIRTNGRGEITAKVMAAVLEAFVTYTDSAEDKFIELVQALADAFSALVEEMEGKFENKADALEAALEQFCSNLLTNNFEPWAEALARVLGDKMDLTKTAADNAKGAADDAKTAAQSASGKADDAKGAAVDAKTAAQGADTKAGEAKTAAIAAKDAIDAESDGIEEALQIIRLGNQRPVFVVPNHMKFGVSTLSEFPETMDFSNVTDYVGMFYNCKNLTKAPTINVSELVDVESDTYPQQMFALCQSLADISGLSIRAQDIAALFYLCSSLEEVPAGKIVVTSQSLLQDVFFGCSSLRQVNLTFDLESIAQDFDYIRFTGTFMNCAALQSITFDFQNAAANVKLWFGSDAFIGCSSLTSLPTNILEHSWILAIPEGLTALQAFDASVCKQIVYGGYNNANYALTDIGVLSNFEPEAINLKPCKLLTLTALQNLITSIIPDGSSRTAHFSSESVAIMQADTTVYTYDGNNYTGLIALANAKGWTVTDAS